MAQTKPKTNGSVAYDKWVVVALVIGKNNRIYVIQKRRRGEWRCNCRTPMDRCAHMRRAWHTGQGKVQDVGVQIEEPAAF